MIQILMRGTLILSICISCPSLLANDDSVHIISSIAYDGAMETKITFLFPIALYARNKKWTVEERKIKM